MLIALLIAAPFLIGWGLCLRNYVEERRQREFDQDLVRSLSNRLEIPPGATSGPLTNHSKHTLIVYH